MTYFEVLQYMFSQLPMFHRVGATAYKANLNNALALDEYFHFPHKKIKTIHIAGTNGKGSVSHMLAAILQKAGYKTGLFTSPHLKDFRERIRINGIMVSEAEVIQFIEMNRPFFDKIQPSFFEMTSAFAFEYFAEQNVDIAIIEVGMGGRLDSTNIITPILSVITNIGFDHVEFLGDTLAKIAEEKAGIIKENIPVVIGEFNEETLPVFERFSILKETNLIVADTTYSVDRVLNDKGINSFNVFKGSELLFGNISLDLNGFYQQKNILTVLAAVQVLNDMNFNIPKSSVFDALIETTESTGLLGRWQKIGENPLVVCDTGHNTAGIKWVVKQLLSESYSRLHFVLGMVSDKDISGVLALLPKDAIYYFTNANIPRALPSIELQLKASRFELKGNAYSTVELALKAARENADKSDFIFVGGSTFVVAEVV